MNYLDLVIAAIVGFFMVRGIRKGLINTLTGVLSFILALIISTGLMGTAAGILQDYLRFSKDVSYVVGYLVLFIGTILLFRGVANVILKIFTITSLRWVDRLVGGLLGLMIGGLIVSSVLVSLSFFSFTDTLLPERDESLLYPYARGFFPAFYNIVIKVKPAASTFQELTEDILKSKPLEALRRTDAGRELLEYWDKLKKDKEKESKNRNQFNSANNIQPSQTKHYPASLSAEVESSILPELNHVSGLNVLV